MENPSISSTPPDISDIRLLPYFNRAAIIGALGSYAVKLIIPTVTLTPLGCTAGMVFSLSLTIFTLLIARYPIKWLWTEDRNLITKYCNYGFYLSLPLFVYHTCPVFSVNPLYTYVTLITLVAANIISHIEECKKSDSSFVRIPRRVF